MHIFKNSNCKRNKAIPLWGYFTCHIQYLTYNKLKDHVHIHVATNVENIHIATNIDRRYLPQISSTLFVAT